VKSALKDKEEQKEGERIKEISNGTETLHYMGLPASDSEALERENKELKSQLGAYRKMFDDHMSVMGGNLKKIHDTMNNLQY